MRRTGLFIALGISSAIALTPALASAGNACERDKHDQKVTGTLIGALGGALLGNAIAAPGHRGDGALVGATGGAIVGNQLSRSKAPCPYGYHYVDEYPVVERRTYYETPAPPPVPGYGYGHRVYVAPPPPPPYGYGYRTYYAPPPPPPPPVYEYRRHHRHHDDDDDD